MADSPAPPQPTGVPTVDYPVKEGDTFEKVAESFQIDNWEDLWRFNQALVPNPDMLTARDKDGKPVVIKVPDHRNHELGRKLLKDKAGSASRADGVLGGASWLDPRALFSQTYTDDADQPLPDGTKIRVTDPATGRERTLETQGGRIEARLPRKEFDFRLELFPGFHDELGFFKQEAGKGDIVEEALEKGRSPEDRWKAGLGEAPKDGRLMTGFAAGGEDGGPAAAAPPELDTPQGIEPEDVHDGRDTPETVQTPKRG